MSIAIAVGVTTTAAVFLMMHRGMVRIILGFVLISHAANLAIFAAGNVAFRETPYIGQGAPADQADPLPQAFVLTAIVIAFSITMFMLTLAITTTDDDDTEDVGVTPVAVIASSFGDDSGSTSAELGNAGSGAPGTGERGAHPPEAGRSPAQIDRDREGRA